MKWMRVPIFLFVAGTAFAAAPVTETHSYDLGADGTIQIQNAAGDISIEAWDQPRVELIVIKNAPDPKLLEKINVTAEAGANTLTITSAYPKYPRLERPFRWTLNFDLSYRIKAPSTAKLAIDAYAGQVNVSGISGEITAADRNGDIFLLIPDGNYAIHAKSKIGQIVSDFPGSEHRNALLFGHEFISSSETGRKLELSTRTGAVTILKMHRGAGLTGRPPAGPADF